MDKVNIELWIGSNFSSNEEYLKYFQQNENANPLDPEYVEECQFCADIDDIWFDTECMIIPERFPSLQDIHTIIDGIKVDENEKINILKSCEQQGITSANAFFWYINADSEVELEVNKPYKESYNGLKYIGRFNATTQYDPVIVATDVTEQHMWIGTNSLAKKEYDRYFKLDYVANSVDAPDYLACDFCLDLGIRWYDEDFIGYPKPLKREVTIPKLIEKIFGPQFSCEQEIVERCKILGIEKANALFWYDASLVDINESYKESYNGLKYIGTFKF